jgi:2-hydroxychromene-2-carboxylate isomerase
MLHASWYFDFVSPFAYLQWQKILVLSEQVPFVLRPVLFAGLLDRNGQKGPAEIPSKRVFTYQFVCWRARQQRLALNFPPAHPFNPLAALRLCIAAGNSVAAIDAIFNHLWRHGRRGDSPEALAELSRSLGLCKNQDAIDSTDLKNALHENFAAAIGDKVFGVPTIVADGHLFWGDDATAMFEAYLQDRGMFTTSEMKRLESLPVGKHRRE